MVRNDTANNLKSSSPIGHGVLDRIATLGRLMDEEVEVGLGGVVMPGAAARIWFETGKVPADVRRKASRPPTGSWKRTTGWQGTTRESGRRPAGETEPGSLGPVQRKYEAQLEELLDAYPDTEVWVRDDSLFLVVETDPVPGLQRRALIAILVTYSPIRLWRAWAYWDDGKWIGPRHTNVDGSICAFHNAHPNAWRYGDDLLSLVDKMSVWVFQQIHASFLGFWPGRQLNLNPFERAMEQRDVELCGCKENTRDAPYSECCKDKDRKVIRIRDVVRYFTNHPGFRRKPPEAITLVVNRNVGEAPDLMELLAPQLLENESLVRTPWRGLPLPNIAFIKQLLDARLLK